MSARERYLSGPFLYLWRRPTKLRQRPRFQFDEFEAGESIARFNILVGTNLDVLVFANPGEQIGRLFRVGTQVNDLCAIVFRPHGNSNQVDVQFVRQSDLQIRRTQDRW